MKDTFGWFITTKTQLLMSCLNKMTLSLIHHQNLQKLTVKKFKVSRGLIPEIINEIFQFIEEITYELKQRSQFHAPSVHSVLRGADTLNDMKQLESLEKFRKEIKQWKPTSCSCRFYKRYIDRIRFL